MNMATLRALGLSSVRSSPRRALRARAGNPEGGEGLEVNPIGETIKMAYKPDEGKKIFFGVFTAPVGELQSECICTGLCFEPLFLGRRPREPAQQAGAHQAPGGGGMQPDQH